MTSETIHRYNCTIHDGDGCDTHCAMTADKLIGWYANDIAFVAEEASATTLDAFAGQVGTAGSRMEDVGINGAEELDAASTYLADAANTSGTEQEVLLKRAADLLNGVTDMVDEYRLMV